MPLFGFSCTACGASREVLAGIEKCRNLEFICIHCGGTMYLDPVMNIHIKATRTDKTQTNMADATSTQKQCGHGYACRCAIKLTEPNPFRHQL